MDVAAVSHRGRRDKNDDVVFAGQGLVVLADGVGGHAGGQEAAMAAVGAAMQRLTVRTEQSVRDAFTAANAAVLGHQLGNPEHADAACTLTIVAVRDHPVVGPEAIVGHAGDSPAFLLRDQEMTLLTPPHTVAEGLRQEGRLTQEQAETHPSRNTLHTSVGGGDGLEPELKIISLGRTDRLLICSDGLLDVPDRRVLRRLAFGTGRAEEIAGSLATHALETSSDNVTVAVMNPGAGGEGGARIRSGS